MVPGAALVPATAAVPVPAAPVRPGKAKPVAGAPAAAADRSGFKMKGNRVTIREIGPL